MVTELNRRRVLKTMAAAAAVSALPRTRRAFADGPPIVLGVPTSQTAAHGVADDQDHLNGTMLAQ